MVICTIPVDALANCDWMSYDNSGKRICIGRRMFEGSCPCRKIIEDQDDTTYLNTSLPQNLNK